MAAYVELDGKQVGLCIQLVNNLLLRPRERLQSIVMGMSVCLSVCAKIFPVPHG